MARARWPRPWASVRPAKTPRARRVPDAASARRRGTGGRPGRRRRAASRPPPRGAPPCRSSPATIPSRNQSSARPVAAIAAPTLYGPASGAGVTNAPGDLDRLVPVDAEAAGGRRPDRRRRRGRAGPRRGSSRRRRSCRPRPGCRHAARGPRRRLRSARPTTRARRAGRRQLAPPGRRCRGHDGRVRGGLVRGPRRDRDARSGGTPATPRSRGTSASPRRRSARAAPATARPAAPPSAQPRMPVAAASSAASAVERVSSQVIAGRVASPRASTGDERRAVPVDADRDDLGAARRLADLADGADDRGPPGAGVLLRPARLRADRHRVAGPRERQEPAVEVTRPALTSVVPRSRPRTPARGAHGAPLVRRERRGVERHHGLGRRDIGDERPRRRRPGARPGSAGPSPRPPRRRSPPGRAPARGASKAITRSRRAGQTNAPSRSNGATRTSPTAPAASSSRGHIRADRRRRPSRGRRCRRARRRGDPTARATARTPACATSAVSRRGVVDQPRRHQAVRLGAERLGDPAVRLALGAGRPVPAAQRHDRGRDRGRGVASPSASAVAETDAPSPIPTIAPVADRGPQHLGREPPDHAPGEVLRTGDRRAPGGRRRGRSVAAGHRRRGSRPGPSRRSGSRRCPRPGRA